MSDHSIRAYVRPDYHDGLTILEIDGSSYSLHVEVDVADWWALPGPTKAYVRRRVCLSVAGIVSTC